MKDYKPALISISLNPQVLKDQLLIISNPEVVTHQEMVYSSKVKNTVTAQKMSNMIKNMDLMGTLEKDLPAEALFTDYLKLAFINAQKYTENDANRTRKKLYVENFGTQIIYDPLQKTTKEFESDEQIKIFREFLNINLPTDSEFIESIFGQHCISGFENKYLQQKNSQILEELGVIITTSYDNSRHSDQLKQYLNDNKPNKDISSPDDDGIKRFLDLYLPDNLRVTLNKDKKIDRLEVTNSYFMSAQSETYPVIVTITTEIDLDNDDRYNRSVLGAAKIKSLNSVLKVIPNPIYEDHVKKQEKDLNPQSFADFKTEEKRKINKLARFLNIISQDSPKSFFERIFGIRDKTQDFEASLSKIIEQPEKTNFLQKIKNFLDESLKLAFPDYQHSFNNSKTKKSENSSEKISEKDEKFLVKILKIIFPDYKNFPQIGTEAESRKPQEKPSKLSQQSGQKSYSPSELPAATRPNQEIDSQEI